ncbi:hypothetical protein Q5H93_23245 [Hymenobacter sp. ASUV-10]|uniref:Uncharacterized protein n=1 Tax=Hymenobacter aranciens TaxID=3063996 RepID=A0ABT9BJ19_9BACT|nr:hypothetical protein [Hymenobacter sp. ASUV-10]MDO7877674.1 hypothetical protein [Hymenobacter sp. ASUV-10]
MIGLKVAGGWLDLAAGTISMEINNPLFDTESVPGTITYPFALVLSPDNLVRLNFPHLRADQGERVAPEPTEFYIDGVMRWVGSLVYLEHDEERAQLLYNFVAEAADLQSRIAGRQLRDLALGDVPLVLTHDAADYALPCLVNSQFYEAEKAPDYCGVVNQYTGGTYRPTLYPGNGAVLHSPIVPFLRLVPLLRRVLAAVGYGLSGEWLNEPEVQALVIYSNRAAEEADASLPATITLSQYVPDMEVATLLLALQKFFGLAYTFHPVRRELRIRTLRDVLADPAYQVRTGGPARSTAVTQQGFVLTMATPGDDLDKSLGTSWATLRVGGGQQELQVEAGTLHVVPTRDPIFTDREWLVPCAEAKGASLAYETGDDSSVGLFLLLDRGLQPDKLGQLYPLATWGRENGDGFPVGASTLHWDGSFGLYATWHQAWLDFLDRATTKERAMQLRVGALLTLDPTRKELVDGKKYLWEKVSLNLSTTGTPLETAQFTYRYCRL